MIKIDNITTEQRNNQTLDIDKVSSLELVKLINDQDKQVALAVEKVLPEVASATDLAYETIKNGGRVIYVGAGTSGRLGILDASEILPTYGESSWFVGVIAGGSKAITTPVEFAEDNKEAAIEDLKSLNASNQDLIVGIAASGRTPYVVSALDYAKTIGAKSISISTSSDTEISRHADIAIEAVTGPETVTGSTRMKSGTAQKMILNMISTGVAVKMGKTYSNLLVDMKATNEKLYSRAVNLVSTITSLEKEAAKELFEAANQNIKVAIVMHIKNVSAQEALLLISNAQGRLVEILKK